MNAIPLGGYSGASVSHLWLETTFHARVITRPGLGAKFADSFAEPEQLRDGA